MIEAVRLAVERFTSGLNDEYKSIYEKKLMVHNLWRDNRSINNCNVGDFLKLFRSDGFWHNGRISRIIFNSNHSNTLIVKGSGEDEWEEFVCQNSKRLSKLPETVNNDVRNIFIAHPPPLNSSLTSEQTEGSRMLSWMFRAIQYMIDGNRNQRIFDQSSN